VFRVEGHPVETPFPIAVLLGSSNSITATDADELQARVHGLLRICALEGHRTLVLGAWACGVRRHHPAAVAQAFRLALSKEADHFSHVVFAVKGDPVAFGAFEEVFRDCAEVRS
jgi:uncharacterized protein (TIGR02452 family)